METVEIEGRVFEVTGRDHNNTPIIKGHATTVHELDEDGNPKFDEEGNPVKSVHISVSPVQAPVEDNQ